MTNNSLGKVGSKLQERKVKASADADPADAVPKRPAAAGMPGEDLVKGKRRRGSGEVVFQTVRLRREDWLRMTELRTSDGLSSQEQFIMALGLLFAQYGLPPPVAP